MSRRGRSSAFGNETEATRAQDLVAKRARAGSDDSAGVAGRTPPLDAPAGVPARAAVIHAARVLNLSVPAAGGAAEGPALPPAPAAAGGGAGVSAAMPTAVLPLLSLSPVGAATQAARVPHGLTGSGSLPSLLKRIISSETVPGDSAISAATAPEGEVGLDLGPDSSMGAVLAEMTFGDEGEKSAPGSCTPPSSRRASFFVPSAPVAAKKGYRPSVVNAPIFRAFNKHQE